MTMKLEQCEIKQVAQLGSAYNVSNTAVHGEAGRGHTCCYTKSPVL